MFQNAGSSGVHIPFQTSWKITSLLCFAINYHILFTTVLAQRRPLEGLQLQCCTLPEYPITFQEQNEKHTFDFDGLAIDYLTVLQEKLGFRCKTLELFKAKNESNQGATGFVYELEKCTRNGTIIDSSECQCDIGVGGWARNTERLGRVDFVLPFAADDFRVLTHVDNLVSHSTRGAFFVTAFSPTAWMAIFGLIGCFIFLKLFDRRFTPPDPNLSLPSDANTLSHIKRYFMSTKLFERLKVATKNTMLEIIGQSTDEVQSESATCRYWTLTYIILLCGIFLILAYEAAMTASLVQEVASSEFRTIDDLKTCRVPASDVCLPGGGAVEALWNSLIANQPCQEGAAKPTVLAANTYTEGHRMVASKECKYFIGSGATTRSAENGRYCGQVATTGEPFSPSGLSFILPRASNLTDIFDRATLQLTTTNGIDTLNRYFRNTGECARTTEVSLSFGRLNLFFVSAFAACLLMLVWMVVFPKEKIRQSKGMNAKGRTILSSKSTEEDSLGSDSLSELSISRSDGINISDI